MKKKVVLIIFVLFCASTNIYAQSREQQELWNTAISHMAAQRYHAAIDIFKSLTNSPDFRKDAEMKIVECEKKIAYIQIATLDGVLKEDRVLVVGYGGTDTTLVIKTNYAWRIEDYSSGVEVEKNGNNNLRIKVVDENLELDKKYKYITISAGNAPNRIERTIKVLQEAHPAYLQCSSRELTVPAEGSLDSIMVRTNTKWSVACADEWCNVVCSSNNIKINVQGNSSTESRQTRVVVNSEQDSKLSIIVEINQTASDAELEVSKQDLYLSASESSEYIRVISNTKWSIDGYPNWATVKRVGNSDSIRIQCYENRTGIEREGNVNIKAGDNIISVRLFQETKPFFPQYEYDMVGGRNLSFGFSMGYLNPIIQNFATSDFVGSPINYALGNNNESASYLSQGGLSINSHVDFRIHKNIYIISGLSFLHYNYKNEFQSVVRREIHKTNSIALCGDTQNKYSENYTFNVLEMPILASFRFPMEERGHLQLNIGAVLGYGISSSMRLVGNTDSETMHFYKVKGHQVTDELYDSRKYALHYAVNGELDLYTKVVSLSEIYTTGNNSTVNKSRTLDASPYKRFQLGTRIGVAYEYLGVVLGVEYGLMLTNLANEKYWNGDRLKVFDQTANSIMSGYEQHNNCLSIKLGYIFRY